MAVRRSLVAVLLPLLGVLLAGQTYRPAPLLAQGAPFNLPGTTVGSAPVGGATWNFDGDLDGAGPWATLVVTNVQCGAQVRPGTAQAGLIYFTAQLEETATQSGATVYQGDLSGRDTVQPNPPAGHVRVVVSSGANPTTHVDATMWNLPGFFMGETFSVCLAPAAPNTVAATIAADSRQVVAMGYDVMGVVTTPGPDGGTFIAIAGAKIGTADGYTQWVFFFSGTTYLGTDTAVPSPQLQLVGSPGAGQIDIQYTNYGPNDPLCCPSLPPVTITYTWDGTRVTPNGTPPGH